MDANVSLFPGVTPLDFGADIILDAAKGNVFRVVIIGETEDGDEFFLHQSLMGLRYYGCLREQSLSF